MNTPDPSSALSRRRLFAGAGTVGALAAVAAVLPAAPQVQPVAATPQPEPEAKDGYQETAHVLRYYQTARV
jgi:cysteine synthase